MTELSIKMIGNKLTPIILLIFIIVLLNISSINAHAVTAKKVAFYGDSITIGYNLNGNTGSAQAWPNVLMNRSQMSGYTFVNHGIGGLTSTQMIPILTGNLSTDSAQYVVVMIGTNDVYYNVSETTVKTNYVTAISDITASGGIPILCTILPFDTGNATQKTEANDLNAWIRGYAYNNNILLFDANNIICNINDPNTFLTSMEDTGNPLHPSVAGYSYLAYHFNTKEFTVSSASAMYPFSFNPMGFNYTQDVVYTNNYGSELTNYSTFLWVNNQSSASSGWNLNSIHIGEPYTFWDVVITDSNGYPLNYYNEYQIPLTQAQFDFLAPDIPSDNYKFRVFYNNASYSDKGNGNNAFPLLFSQWSTQSTIDTGKWTVSGTPTWNNAGYMQFTNGQGIYSNGDNFGLNTELIAKTYNYSSGYGVNTYSTYSVTGNHIGYIQHNSPNDFAVFTTTYATANYLETYQSKSSSTSYHDLTNTVSTSSGGFGIARQDSTHTNYIYSGTTYTSTVAASTNNMGIRIISNGAEQINISVVYVRPYYSPEPAPSSYSSERLTNTLYNGNVPSGNLQANFNAAPTTGSAPLQVQFADQSTGGPVSWQWNFGDNSANSTAQNPSHIYATNGTYTVTLTVSNGYSLSSIQYQNCIIVTGASGADFYGAPTSGSGPLTVSFYDTSNNNPTNWQWNFGDGSPNATTQNPSHMYLSPGSYTVTLTTTGSFTSSVQIPGYIQVNNGSAAFSLSSTSYTCYPSSGNIIIPVLFTGSSSTASVQYTTIAGTATPGVNYQTVTGTLTFSPGQTTQNITIPITNTSTLYSLQFYINIYSPINGTLNANPNYDTASITIIGNSSNGGSATSITTMPVRFYFEKGRTTYYPGTIATIYQNGTVQNTSTTGADGSATFLLWYGMNYQVNANLPGRFNFSFNIIPAEEDYYIDVSTNPPTITPGSQIANGMIGNVRLVAASNASLLGWTYGLNVYPGITMVVTLNGVQAGSGITGSDGSTYINTLYVDTAYTVSASGPGIVNMSQPITTSNGVTTYYIWVTQSSMTTGNPGASPVPAGTTYSGDLTKDITLKYNYNLASDGTTGIVNESYQDLTGGTSSLTYKVYLQNPSTKSYQLVQTITGNTPNDTTTITIPNAAGQSYMINATAQNGYYGLIWRTEYPSFPQQTSYNTGWPADLQMIVSLGILAAIAGTGGRKYMIAKLWIMDVVGWIMYAAGMMAAIGAWAPTGLALGLCFLFVRALGDYRAKHRV